MSLAVPIREMVTAEKPYFWRTLVAGDLGSSRSSDGYKSKMIRMVILSFFKEFIFDQAQLDHLETWLGEAITNAFEHNSVDRYVVVVLKKDRASFVVEIANPSQGYCGDDQTVDPFAEKGRGRYMMAYAVAVLQKLGLGIEEDCKFIPDGDNGSGQTIVSLSLGLEGGVEVA